LVAGLVSGSCSSDPTGANGSDELTPLRFTVFTVGTPISTLVVEITADDINRRLVYNLQVVDGVASGTVDVPAGEARTFTVTAFDDQHNVTHEGSATADVSPGNNPPLRVKLKPIAGEVEVIATFGEYTVLVTPASATIDAAISDQLQLEVAVIDPDDEAVPDPQVLWATTHPSLATVTASGLVTGLANGEVTIVAAYDGVAGLSEVTLIGFGGISPSPEVCNGIDDDLDGEIDEGTDSDCTTCYVCVNGECTPAALLTDPKQDCGPGFVCDGAGSCIPVSPEVCNGIDDDLDGEVDEGMVYCINGQAAPNTDGENSCLPGFYDYDEDATNGCEYALPTSCASGSDCPPGFFCDEWAGCVALPFCVTGSDCPTCHVCVDESCVPAPAGTDPNADCGPGFVCDGAGNCVPELEACTGAETGLRRCNGDVLEECTGTVWEVVSDCAASGQNCVVTAGLAACEAP
jgi:hypothetical protein